MSEQVIAFLFISYNFYFKLYKSKELVRQEIKGHFLFS